MLAMNTVMMWQTRSTGSADTEQLGETLGKLLRGGEVIELKADLGGGKTTFVRGLVRGVGSHSVVTSPTFTLSKIYRSKKGLGLHHFDFYRLGETDIIVDQLRESLQDSTAITVVEWSERLKSILPADRINITFEPVAGASDERSILIKYPETKTSLVKSLKTAWAKIKP